MSEGNGKSSFTVSTSTIQFLIQLGVLLATILSFGFSIKGAVAVQAVQLLEQQKNIDSLERNIENLEKKIELMRYDLGEMATDVGIMKSGRWRPTKNGE